MEIWIGAEIERDVYDDYVVCCKEVEQKLEPLLERNYGEGVVKWALVPIILVGQSNVGTDEHGACFPEGCEYNPKTGFAGFGPAIDHSSFKEADLQTKSKMLAQALLRSTVMAKDLNIPNFDLASFATDLQDIAREQGWTE